jgi:hypothetical protein
MTLSRSVLKRMHPKLRAAMGLAREAGCTFEHGGKHIAVLSPAGKRIATVAKSPSCERDKLNIASDLRRAVMNLNTNTKD